MEASSFLLLFVDVVVFFVGEEEFLNLRLILPADVSRLVMVAGFQNGFS